MKKLSLPTVQSIITWANDAALINEVMFLGGRPSMPYIKRNGLFYYFKLDGRDYVLTMSSLHDLGSF